MSFFLNYAPSFRRPKYSMQTPAGQQHVIQQCATVELIGSSAGVAVLQAPALVFLRLLVTVKGMVIRHMFI